MSQIEGGRWDSIVRKLFNISAPSALPAIADELIPTVTVQNWEPELYALRRERLLVGTAASGAVVGELSHSALTNPVNSNVLMIIEHLIPRSGAGLEVALSIEPEELTAGLGWIQAPYGNRDLRWTGGAVLDNNLSAARLVVQTAAVAQGNQVARFQVDASGLRGGVPILPFILPPNTGIILRGIASNVALRCSWFWRERPFNPQEGP